MKNKTKPGEMTFGSSCKEFWEIQGLKNQHSAANLLKTLSSITAVANNLFAATLMGDQPSSSTTHMKPCLYSVSANDNLRTGHSQATSSSYAT